MDNFDTLDLPEALRHTLTHMQFSTPTPIQAQAIPPALEGRDILGSAQTGTGKTAAFGIPLVCRLMSSPDGSALVMTPTRELAVQVMKQLQTMLGRRSPIRSALLIGGESMPKQFQQLRQHPRLIVGTPGRINDHLERGSLKLHDAGFLVLDETDRMLDMGFTIQIERIMKYLPQKRQTLLFSATLPHNIVRIAENYLTQPVRVAVSGTSAPAENIKQETIHVGEGEKYSQLLTQLEARTGSIIVFMKTKYATEKMAVKLAKEGHSAEAIHGDLRQNKRDRVIANFRNQKHRILVATDVAARGLDIPHIEHVINFDLPQCPEDYIHRIGRTARAGAEGSALCFISPADRAKWRAIERLLDPNASSQHHNDDRAAGKPRAKSHAKPYAKSYGKPNHAGKPARPARPAHAGKPAYAGNAAQEGNPAHAGKPARPARPAYAGNAATGESTGYAGNAGKYNKPARPAHAGKPTHAGKPANGENAGKYKPAKSGKPFRAEGAAKKPEGGAKPFRFKKHRRDANSPRANRNAA